jgi:hypothetical protein
MSSIRIPIKVTSANIWTTIRKHSYSAKALQALCELIDNAITAINLMNRKTCGYIILNIDFEKRTATIEDNGCGFPNEIDKLANAWSYGVPNPHGLSEHGCGAKSALSIFDKDNNDWSCYWKNGNGKIYKVKAPLDDNFERHEVDIWPGEVSEPTGTFMSFPFSEECRASLYTKGTKGIRNEKGRIIQHLAQTYMMEPNLKNGSIILRVNNEKVEPFSLSKGEDTSRYIGPNRFTLTSGATVDLTMVEIKQEVKGSWFNRNQSNCGIRIWKQGRHIQHISSGEGFKRLTGLATHPSLNGNIMLISIFGEQSQMPSTDPTKTVISETDELYDELCTIIKPFINKFLRDGEGTDIVHERDLVVDFTEMRRLNMIEIPGYSIDINKSYEGKTPPIDIVETISEQHIIYEAKRDNRASWPAIAQLFANYKLVSHISDKPVKKAVLLIHAHERDVIMNDTLKEWIASLTNFEFPFFIYNYEGRCLWPNDKAIVAPQKKKDNKSKV